MNSLALFQAALQSSGQPAIIDRQGSHSYTELLQQAAEVRQALLSDKSDLHEARVAFLIEPGFEYVAVQWGIWQAGGVATPLGLKHPTPELEHVLQDADVSTVVVQPSCKDRVASIALKHRCRLLDTQEIAAQATKQPATTQLATNITSDRRAMILYTSGSTGLPKGVVTTHANILAQIDALVDAWNWHRDDHILHVLPMHHIHGIINVLGCAMRVGGVCEFLPSFNPQDVWSRFARGGLTLFMAVPTIYAKLIAAWEQASPATQKEWSAGAQKLRLMVSGSAALPIPTLETWESITGQRLLERYGMTEIGMALSNPLDGVRRAGHVGKPLPQVKVQRTNEAGEVVDDKTPGEIEVQGPNVFQAYWGQSEVTTASFRNGWFRTGDVAVVDQGDYRILGRNSVDIIKTGGYKISALEIEDVLRTHPQIQDCAVVGIPDEEWGERVAVNVVCPDGKTLTLEPLRAWCKERLAAYKAPSLLKVSEQLPRNAMGKVQKPQIRALFSPSSPPS